MDEAVEDASSQKQDLKKKVGFYMEVDIFLLKEVLAANPYMNFNIWKQLADLLVSEFQQPFTSRNVRERVDYLLKVFSSKERTVLKKSGTEEQYSTRELLLEDVKALRDEFKVAPCGNRGKKQEADEGKRLRDEAAITQMNEHSTYQETFEKRIDADYQDDVIITMKNEVILEERDPTDPPVVNSTVLVAPSVSSQLSQIQSGHTMYIERSTHVEIGTPGGDLNSVPAAPSLSSQLPHSTTLAMKSGHTSIGRSNHVEIGTPGSDLNSVPIVPPALSFQGLTNETNAHRNPGREGGLGKRWPTKRGPQLEKTVVGYLKMKQQTDHEHRMSLLKLRQQEIENERRRIAIDEKRFALQERNQDVNERTQLKILELVNSLVNKFSEQ